MIFIANRINRRSFLISQLGICIFLFIYSFLTGLMYDFLIMDLFIVGLAVYFIIGVSVARLHDLNRTGWWAVFSVVPVFCFVLFFILLLRSGYKDKNKYGKIPNKYTIFKLEKKSIKDERNDWIIAVVIVFLGMFLSFYFINSNDYLEQQKEEKEISKSSVSNKEFIESVVLEIKNSELLPRRVDEISSLTDVIAKENSIQYVYTVSGDIDTISLLYQEMDEDLLKDYVVFSVCKNDDLVYILNKGIILEHYYEINQLGKTFSINIGKKDCLK